MTRRDAVALAILVSVLSLIFSDVLFLGRAFYFRDVTRFYYPMKKVTRDIILSGEFPSWNPALSEGQPLAANPEFAVFYPPNWLLLLPNYEAAFRLHILLHYYLAAIGVYLLLRGRGLRIESALFGAFAYTLGGLLLSLSCLIPYLFCLAWLPWVAFFSLRQTRRGAALAALCLAMILLGGEPVTIAQCLLLLTVFVWRRSPALGGLTAGAAFLMAAVQIIPAADHLRDSVRSHPFSFSLVSTWSTPPLKAIELFIPGVLGPAGEHARFYWGTAHYGWLDPFLLSVYPGLLVIALAAAALTLRRAGWILVTVTLAAGLLLALGSHTPLLRLLYESRIFSSFRYPEKFLILAVIPLTLFAAFALDRIDEAMVRRAMRFTAMSGAVCLVLALLALTPQYSAAFSRFFTIEVHPLRIKMAALSAGTWWLGLGRAVAATLFLAARGRMRTEVWSRLAVALLVLDLGMERPAVAETIESRFFAPPRTVARFLPGEGRLFHQADWYSATAVSRHYFDLPEMYWVIRNGAFPLTSAAWGLKNALNRDIDQTTLLPTGDLLGAMRELRGRTPRWTEAMAAIANVGARAVFLPPQLAGRGQAIRPIVFVPMAANGFFYFADRVTGRRLADAAADPDWTPRTACLQEAAGFPARPQAGEVLASSQTSHSARLSVQTAGPGLLVCSITRHKYWHAFVDGSPVDLIAANVAFQALSVPPGRHEVVLRYENPLLRWCGALSALAALATVILAIIPSGDRTQLRPR